MVGISSLPHWLETLLGEKFFNPCLIHESAKKNEKNIFCLDCCTSICPHCLSPHRSHRLLQVRRYVYHDVIRVDDIEKLINCDYVQSYTTNSAKVVFLNQRPQSRPFRGSGNVCTICDRSLQDPYLFCSLACKVRQLVRTEGGISKYLYECEYLPLPEGTKGESCDLDDGQMTPDSVLESPVSLLTSSGSSASGGGVGCKTLACTATTEFVKKKRSSISGPRTTPYRATCSRVSEITMSLNRRKSIPHRSPLY
ncbi:protein RGF1 INDUCIBLE TRANSCRIPTION FACTOR 1 [Macadamia integrifolia]|uniref:protein RGF1 INDUCIBLE TRANSCRIPTION FACTOR 1 n=1 Tax=Macadamia integrifolia TaxID=60698 RepID=UPI001C4EE99F|nr:protein RGF1 INDUCIBLE TRANSCRIPTION FACTOR 1 [Macadamia integrifolia]